MVKAAFELLSTLEGKLREHWEGQVEKALPAFPGAVKKSELLERTTWPGAVPTRTATVEQTCLCLSLTGKRPTNVCVCVGGVVSSLCSDSQKGPIV